LDHAQSEVMLHFSQASILKLNAATALEVKRVPLSEDLLHSGDYIFIGKRGPHRTFQSIAITAPDHRDW
jgi:hypothetical protein